MTRLSRIIEKIQQNQRIGMDEALPLLRDLDLMTLGYLANQKRFFHHPDPVVTYVNDRNINYTNICVSKCRFCAFCKTPGQEEGYVISTEDLHAKIRETIDLGGTQILLQGGMNPDLGLDFYENMLTDIKAHFDIHIHGFSPPEIHFMAQKFHLSVADTIHRLRMAGLDSIPGGGAEILCDEIRKKVSPDKCSAGEWLEVMRQAHMVGMRSSATMMFGHLEQDIHVIKHLERIRQLQDETGGFTAFIPWTFQPANTKIQVAKKTGVEYLKVLAVSRIYLDNVDNIQASWVTQGDKIAQTALFFGANDMGSTMIEENVVAAAGVDFMLPVNELQRLISTAGFTPRQRDCYYHLL
jgi:cyclic dehypoxanthinyl futalosine synthase